MWGKLKCDLLCSLHQETSAQVFVHHESLYNAVQQFGHSCRQQCIITLLPLDHSNHMATVTIDELSQQYNKPS